MSLWNETRRANESYLLETQTGSKMDEEKLDISIIQHFASGVGLDKKKKKKLLALFKYLAGGESPIEAVELTVRRDHNLREAQLKMVYEMVKIVEHPPTFVSNNSMSNIYLF